MAESPPTGRRHGEAARGPQHARPGDRGTYLGAALLGAVVLALAAALVMAWVE